MHAVRRTVILSFLMVSAAIAPERSGIAADATSSPPHPFPLGVSSALYTNAVPPDRVPTNAQIDLGQQLFNDKRLSSDNTVACATCHDPDKGFTDHRDNNATSAGVSGQHGQRNSPSVLNA